MMYEVTFEIINQSVAKENFRKKNMHAIVPVTKYESQESIMNCVPMDK